MTLAVGVRGNGGDPNAGVTSQLTQSSVDAVPAANKDPRKIVVVATQFLAGIIPIRRNILSSKPLFWNNQNFLITNLFIFQQRHDQFSLLFKK